MVAAPEQSGVNRTRLMLVQIETAAPKGAAAFFDYGIRSDLAPESKRSTGYEKPSSQWKEYMDVGCAQPPY